MLFLKLGGLLVVWGPLEFASSQKEGTTVQSDLDGISRIHFRENIEEKVLDIQRELEAVGLLRG